MTLEATTGHTGIRLTPPSLVLASTRALLSSSAFRWTCAAMLVLACCAGAIAAAIGRAQGADAAVSVGTVLPLFAALLQFVAVIVGADAVGGEFASGTIESTLTVVPRRQLLLTAKILSTCGTVAALAFLTGLVLAASALLIALTAGERTQPRLLASALIGSCGLAVGTSAVALAALALGAAARQRTLPILAAVMVLYLLPVAAALLPATPRDVASVLLPSSALNRLTGPGIWNPNTGTSALAGSLTALLILALWCLLIVPASAFAFVRRDLTVATRRRPAPAPRERKPSNGGASHVVTFGGLWLSELRKYFSLRTVPWILSLAIAAEILLASARALFGSVEAVGGAPEESLAIEYGYAVTGGIGTAAVLTALAAVALVSSEYETGTATLTFIAARRRWQVTTAKALTAMLTGVLIAGVGLGLTLVTTALIYNARGYHITEAVLTAGAAAVLRGTLFICLITLLTAGIAGVTRRSTATVVLTCILLIVGPALLNAVLAVARATGGPLTAVGNAGRLLPWEGSQYYSPAPEPGLLATIDPQGILQVSSTFGILITALWTASALLAWLIADTRRSISSD